MEQEKPVGYWAVVSLMGHQTMAGFMSEFVMGGCSFIQLTVPETESQPEFTKLFTDKAVYSIDFVDEKTARAKAASLKSAPISIWDAEEMFKKGWEKSGMALVKINQLPEGFLEEQAEKSTPKGYQEGADFFYEDGEEDNDPQPF